MSVRQALLALLEQGPMYGYQLRAEFEQRTGATWPLNVGQVYTTLTRLERDGLVESAEDARCRRAPGPSRVIYRVTPAGRDEVSAWFTTPVPRTQPPRDELAIKLAIAVTVPGVDVGRVIQQQRTATMAALQDYTRLKRGGRAASPEDRADMAWSLVLDSLVFGAEAEIRWLDHCESRLRRAAAQRPAPESSVEKSSSVEPSRPRARRAPADDRRAPPRRGDPRPRRGRDRGGRPARRLVRGVRRRAGRGDGPLRLRQVHAAHAGRRPRPADRPARSRSRAPTSRCSAPGAGPGCGAPRWATSSRTST